MGTGINPYQNDRPHYPLTRGPHELIEDQVELTPDAPAMTMGTERISYRELNSRANRLAHFLRQQGVGPGVIVGIYLDRSFDSDISFLAILKCGGIYLPLDPKFPKSRIEFMIADSGLSLLLTSSARQQTLPQTTARVLLLDRESEAIAKAPAANLCLSGNPEQIAYIIYTSGSTGKPKGVMIPRRALVNFLLSMAETPGMNAQDTLLAITPTSFDISILDLLLPFVCGAHVIMATAEQAADGRELQNLLRQFPVTVLQATPASWRMLLDSGWEGKSDLRVLCGGEAMTSDLARQLLPRCRELWNMYGPTETTVWSSVQRVTVADNISLGSPIANTQLYVLDENRKPVSAGQPGELWIGGTGLALGYFKRPELTAEKFVLDSALDQKNPDPRIYRTGDEVRFRPDGSLQFLGRLDHQVKLHGFRIELGEIECALTNIAGIGQAVVMLREDRPGDKRLVAYYTGGEGLTSTQLFQSLKATLPDYMVPSAFVGLEKFPLTPNGKLDRKALPQPGNKRPLLAQDFIAPHTAEEKQLADLWRELLQLDEIGIDDSFFDLGGNSLAAVRMVRQYHVRFGQEIPAVKVFQHPTIAKLAKFLAGNEHKTNFQIKTGDRPGMSRQQQQTPGHQHQSTHDAIAVIGMSGRLPGASNPDELWHNLCNSVESISFFTPEELGPGIDENLRNDPNYIRARGLIEGADLFDASFFGIGPLEAKIMDPQQRVFLELAQHALENAGYDPERYEGRVGVFAGIGDNRYYTTNLLTHPELLAMAGRFAVEYGNEKDYTALRTAYLLDLRGPAISIHTACSTTLLAIDQACRSLRSHECDMALSGGVDITVPQKSGFLYQEGGTFAKDGHCRPFDADATGTMFCDGSGVVILKRLADALADGDTIYSVICGSASNNNGARPASFLAPCVEGQAEVITMAQSDANVPVESIRYIEAHGTGTPVGDPIEFEALQKAFELKTDKKQFCYIGSLKGNIGHPSNAAGVVGLMKTALVLHHEQIPPTLHFKTPNPRIDFANSPFMVADKLIPFPRGPQVRRAAVSSFGFGGTNVHVILEEAPVAKATSPSRPRQLLLLSAKSESALETYSTALAEHLASAAPESFADTAYTFQTGRKQMAYRRFVVAADPREAANLLAQPNPLQCGSKRCERRDPPIVFLFGGQGTQYVNMGLNLYRDEPLFRAVVDDCCEQLKPHLGRDLREVLFPQPGDEAAARASLEDTFFTQPSIFVIEYALARYWQSLGVEPAIMAGHSIGEFVAATLAGVWDLEDVLGIVALRGRLMHNLPRGSMVAVRCSAESLVNVLPASIQIASRNAPNLCVVSGPGADMRAFQMQLELQNIVCRPLHTSHAFHSAMMDPIVEPLREAISKIKLRAPARPFISTVTGSPITAAETTDPVYWAQHARSTVEFAKAIHCLKESGYNLFLECGPRSTMCSLACKQFVSGGSCTAIPTLGDTAEDNAEWETILFALGSLWQNGVSVSWDSFYAHEERRRIPLPTYPFERQRFWVDPAPAVNAVLGQPAHSGAGNTPLEPSAELLTPELVTAQHSLETRKDRIASRVIDLLISISGYERSQISRSATFLEQSFDSLSLTQVAFAMSKEFSVKISFSQLMNQFPTVDMIAVHLDTNLPAGIFAEPSAVSAAIANIPLPPAPSAANAHTTDNPLYKVIAEQAHTIARLVALLENAGVHSPASHADSPVDAIATPDAARLQHNSPQQATAPSAALQAPSTVPQRGIFASSSLSENLSASYNESVTVRFTGNVSIEKMTRAMERLVERHDALRAGFDESGRIMNIIPGLRIALPVIDLAAIQSAINNPKEQEERLRKLIANDTALPFHLPDGPLFRCHMILLGHDRAAIVLTAHHVICDGWSLDVLIHDLCAFYAEEVSGATIPLTPAESYFDYARGVTERELSHEFEEARAYWHRKFAGGFPALVLPTDHARSTRREFKARRTDHSVPAQVLLDLKSMAAKQGCSFFALLLSSLAILFARIARQRRFVIALPTAEQPVAGQPGLVGHCVNLLPFAVELRENESVGAFLKRVQSELIEAQDHAIFTMVSLLGDLRSAAHAQSISPITAGFTNVRKFKPGELPQTGFTVDYDANPKGFESFELYLSAVESEDNLEFHCHYDVKLFEDITIREWLTTLASILRDVASNPSRDVLNLARLERADGSRPTEAVYALASEREMAQESLDFAAESEQGTLLQHSDSSASPTLAEPALLQALLALWRRVLHIRQIGPDEDFFALGGSSMAAAQLFALIQHELGYTAPLSILYNASTPRLLAQSLCHGNSAGSWQSLVAINPHGDRPPLFLVHAAEGNVLLYRSLATHLGADQPVFGLQSDGLDGRSAIDATFEHVARNYINQIRQVQPRGPYLLGGYCLGGTVAMEMAQQLIAAGETVGLVALIEDHNIRAMHWPLPLRQRFINRFILNPYFHLRNVVNAQGAGKLDFFMEKLHVEIRRIQVSVRGRWAALQHRFLPGSASAMPHIKIADIYEDALVRYDVRPYPGELSVFMAGHHLAGFDDPLGGWGQVAQGGVRLYSLPCSPRGSLIEPYVRQLAACLRGCLDRAADESVTFAHKHPFAFAGLDVPADSAQLEAQNRM
jgi:amino acid adenylation domain-containing protein